MNGTPKLLVPKTRLPAEGWELPHECSLNLPALVKLLPEGGKLGFSCSPAGREWRIEDACGEYLVLDLSSSALTVRGLGVVFDGARVLDALRSTPPVDTSGPGSFAAVVCSAVLPLLDGLAPGTRPVLSVVGTQSGRMEIALEAVIIGEFPLGNFEAGNFQSLADGLTAGGKIFCIPAGEVEGRDLRQVVSAAGIGLVILFSQPANAGQGGAAEAGTTAVESENTNLLAPEIQRIDLGEVQGQNRLYVHERLLAEASGRNVEIVVSIADQRALLYVDGELALDTPVSTARPGKRTPLGTFTITERVRSGKRSTIYGTLMPFWMRLNQTPIGLHVGDLPGYPASAGCIRLPTEAARRIFAAAPSGTKVTIVDESIITPSQAGALAAN